MKLVANFITFLLVLYSCQILHGNTQAPEKKYEEEFQKKSKILIENALSVYIPPSYSIEDPEKYYWPLVMARFEKYGIQDSLANYWITLWKDRSPFHFTLVGMARIMSLYPEAPAMKRFRLAYLKKVFERTDSYNAFTCEGTENHVSMSRTSGYLYAQHALDYPVELPDAIEKMDRMKDWILKTSEKICKVGTGEWNSSIYETYNIIGWLNLYDFAKDDEVKHAAQKVLDYYAGSMALHYSWGGIGGPEMRGTGAENGNTNSMNYLCWLWFSPIANHDPLKGKGSQFIQCMHAITSQYRPSSENLMLARKKVDKVICQEFSRPDYLQDKPEFGKETFCYSSSFTLGNFISSYGGWTGSTYQVVPWKLVVRNGNTGIPYEISGNGRFYDEWSGKTVNPFTQSVQYKSVLIQMTLTPLNADSLYQEVSGRVKEWADLWYRDFIKRFPEDPHKSLPEYNPVKLAGKPIFENRSFINLPKDITIRQEQGVFYISAGEVYILVHALPAENIQIKTGEKKYKDREFIISSAEYGKMCGLVMEVVDGKNYQDFDSFCKASGKAGIIRMEDKSLTYQTLEGERITSRYISAGSFSEATVDWGFGPQTPQIFMDPEKFHQPGWFRGEGFGRIPELQVE